MGKELVKQGDQIRFKPLPHILPSPIDKSVLASMSTDGINSTCLPPLQIVNPLSSIHTAKLPTIDVSLDYALMHIDSNTISPWTNPVEWIQADSSYLLTIISRIPILVESDEIKQLCAGVAHQVMIYPVNLRLSQSLVITR